MRRPLNTFCNALEFFRLTAKSPYARFGLFVYIFEVDFPATDPVSGIECSEHERIRPRILVVEDDPALRVLLHRMLDTNARVSCEPSGAQAMARLRQETEVELVICDLNLGDMSGLDLLDQLEGSGQRWRDRFVICTGGSIGDDQNHALEAAQIPVLRKPFRAAVLRRLVEERCPTVSER